MYKRIILAVDLADASPKPKGLDQALELAKAGGGDLRLVNVQPVVPATFMEYVPADFDMEQSKRAQDALEALVASIVPAANTSVLTSAIICIRSRKPSSRCESRPLNVRLCPSYLHCALIQFSDPVNFTDTSVSETRRDFPSAVPR